MSVVLTTVPPLYAFSADQIFAKFTCSNYHQAEGAHANNEISFSSGITAGTSIEIKYGTLNVIMTASAAPDQTGHQFQAGTSSALLLIGYFAANYYLSRDFNLSADGNTITFIAKEKQLGYDFESGSAGLITIQNVIPGSVEVIKPKYSVAFRLYCENLENDGFDLIYSANLSLIGKTGIAEAPIGDKLHTQITKDLRTAFPDIPGTGPLLCKKSCRKYYFDFAESTGDQIFAVTTSDMYTVLHGGLSYIAQFNKTLAGMIAPGEPETDRFLKQGNTEVYTRSNQPQYLYFFHTRAAAAGARVKAKFYFQDDTSSTKTLFIENLEELRKYAFNVRFDEITSPEEFPGKVVAKYEIWIESATGDRKSETRTYWLNYQYRQFVRYFLSWSSFGSLDSRLCYGKGNSEFELFQKEASKILQLGYDVKQGSSIAYDLRGKSSYKVATGWITSRDLVMNRDFFLSAFKYRYVGGLMLPIKVDSTKIPEIEDGNNLFSQLFEYSYLYDNHAYTEGDEEDPGISSGDFFFSSTPIINPSQGFSETDPTVPVWVKAITLQDIEKWNNIPGNDAKFVTVAGDQIFSYSNDMNPVPDKEQVIINATEHNFVGADIERKWEWFNGLIWQQIIGSFGKSLTVLHNSYVFNGTNSATLRYRVGELLDQITLVKVYNGSGALTVVITSEYGDTFLNGNIETTLYANVYYGGENVTDQIPESGFTWIRSSDDAYQDNIWNQNAPHAKSILVDDDDVVKKATFSCEVEIIVNT